MGWRHGFQGLAGSGRFIERALGAVLPATSPEPTRGPTAPLACTRCGSENLGWTTLRRHGPVDVLQCADCGTRLAIEDWTPPLSPLRPGRCVNCGGKRDNDVCTNCGLSREEDQQVHDELRDMIAPELSMLDAAREASRAGRRVLALKLATAAASAPVMKAGSNATEADIARALRVWLLSAVGENQSALEDARAWVEQSPEPSALAWASLGQQQQHHGFPGAAADSYQKALGKDPHQHAIRARRAQLLFAMHREGQALHEATVLFEAGADERSVSIALKVAEDLCDMFAAKSQNDDIVHLLLRVGAYIERSAVLLAHRARVSALQGDAAKARRDLKRARRLEPEHPLYAKVQEIIRPTRASWWRW